MTFYRPILKAKPGEFEAVGALSGAAAAGLTPIFELCPEADLAKGLGNALTKARRYLLPGSIIGLDCGFLPTNIGPIDVAQHAASELASSTIAVMPVVRRTDTAGTLSSLSAVVAAQTGEAILRVDVSAQSVSPAVTAASVGSVTSALGIAMSGVHLVLDCGALTASVAAKSAIIHAQLATVFSIGTWASITVSSGAFPQSISSYPTGGANSISRDDAALWRSLTPGAQVVDFGDYAVNHPALAQGGRGPLPNLRYTVDRDWHIWRESKARPGNESFYELCKKVIAAPGWAGSGYSWGDAQIEAKAAEIGGAGTATQWRAYGTNHHLTSVVDRLASLGEP